MAHLPLFRAGLAALALAATPALSKVPETLAVDRGSAARLKSADADAVAVVPPPELSTLTGTLTADGRVELRCVGVTNPAYLRYRDRLEQATRQGER